MDEQTPNLDHESAAPMHTMPQDDKNVQNANNSAPTNLTKKINTKMLLWDSCCVIAILATVIFGKLWYTSQSESQQRIDAVTASTQDEIEDLKKLNGSKDKKLAENAQTYSQTYKNTAEQFTTDIVSKDSKITKLKRDIVQLNQEKLEVEQRWRTPLKESLEISQDIYAMKWMDNSKEATRKRLKKGII